MKNNGLSRRSFLKYTAGVVGMSTLVACMPAAPAAPAQQEAASGGEAAAAPESQEGVLWGLQYDPHVETYKRLADMYKEQSGVTLAVEPQAWPLETKLIAALSAGTQPDVICIMGKVLIPLHIQKALMPLKESVYDAQGVDPANDFIGDGIGAYTWEGELYGVPTEVTASAMWSTCRWMMSKPPGWTANIRRPMANPSLRATRRCGNWPRRCKWRKMARSSAGA